MNAFLVIATSFAWWALSAGQSEAIQTRFESVGQYEITLSYETSSIGNGQTARSSGHTTLVEKVLSISGEGAELAYSLPSSASEKDIVREWQFPARIFKSNDGTIKLLNADEMELRLERFLLAAKWTRDICGKTIFTWNAVYISCNPNSVIKTIGKYDLGGCGLHAGSLINEESTTGPVALRRSIDGSTDEFTADFQIDPEVIRRQLAETDAQVAEITGNGTTIDEALEKHATDKISGSVRVSLTLGGDGCVKKRISETELDIQTSDGKSEQRRLKNTLERRPITRVKN